MSSTTARLSLFCNLLASSWFFGPSTGLSQDAGSESVPPETAEPSSYQAAVAMAIEHFEEHRYSDARAAFERAHALQPSARTFRGLGFAAFYQGDYALAANSFTRALEDERNPLTADQRGECEIFLARSREHAGRLQILVHPLSAHVTIDDERVAAEPRYVDPGEHHVRIDLEGYETVTRKVKLAKGEVLELHIVLSLERVAPQLTREAEAEAPASAATPLDTKRARRAKQQRFPWAWVTGGATLALGVSAAAFGIVAQRSFDAVRNECERAGCDEARRSRLWDDENVHTYKALTTATLIGAGLGLATTVTLFAVRAGESGESTQLSVGPGQLRLAGTF